MDRKFKKKVSTPTPRMTEFPEVAISQCETFKHGTSEAIYHTKEPQIEFNPS